MVDTAQLRTAAAELRQAATATDLLGGKSGRATAAVPAFGGPTEAKAADSFLQSWFFGVGWIRVQAHELAVVMEVAANRFDTIESSLSQALGCAGPPDGSAYCPPAPLAAPARPASGLDWRRMAPVTQPVKVQLSSARHAGDLIPGDPALVEDLGALLLNLADALAETRLPLALLSLGGWQGLTAYVVEEDLTSLLARLVKAEVAFATAGSAIGTYARVFGQARADAAVALARWQEAEYASQVWRGAVPGVLPDAGSADPTGEAGMAQAAARLAGARESLESAGAVLVAALTDAEADAPDSPGNLAEWGHRVKSLGEGIGLGVAGIVGGAGATVGLAARSFPLRPIWDNEGYERDGRKIREAFEYAIKNLDQVALAAVDAKTFKDDKWKWAGKAIPELVLLGVSGGMSAVSEARRANNRLEDVASEIDAREAGGGSAMPDVDDMSISQRLAEMHLPESSPAGRAAFWQLRRSREPDQWTNGTLHPGQWIAVHLDTGMGMVVDGPITASAREWAERMQIAAKRSRADGISQPLVPGEVVIYEVRGASIDVGHAIARSNPAFGPGGAQVTFVPDFVHHVAAKRLDEVYIHEFRGPRTSLYEDPTFRAVDPDLSERALDPRREAWTGAGEKSLEGTRRVTTGLAVGGLYDRVSQGPTNPQPEQALNIEEEFGGG